jgi:hypothetical protein
MYPVTIDLTPDEAATLIRLVTRRLTALERAKGLDATGIFDDLGARTPTPVEWDATIATYTDILDKLEGRQ